MAVEGKGHCTVRDRVCERRSLRFCFCLVCFLAVTLVSCNWGWLLLGCVLRPRLGLTRRTVVAVHWLGWILRATPSVVFTLDSAVNLSGRPTQLYHPIATACLCSVICVLVCVLFCSCLHLV